MCDSLVDKKFVLASHQGNPFAIPVIVLDEKNGWVCYHPLGGGILPFSSRREEFLSLYREVVDEG